jgi:two-component sensor histidine kinase
MNTLWRRAAQRDQSEADKEYAPSGDLEDDLIARISRLEAALALTAGTVHDVNNVLTVLSGNLYLLAESLRDQGPLHEQARRARNTAERGSTLLRELLTFDREPDNGDKAISPGNHVLALQPLLSRAIGSDHELTVSVDRNAASVMASAAQFESVLINLVINARDALSPGGKVTIRVCNAKVDEKRSSALGLVVGEYVCVEVVDNGSGIPRDLLRYVTQPLFTTKPKGQGSGLGLAMVQRFARHNRGALHIDSEEGRGTKVMVWLPRTSNLAETTSNMTMPLSTLPGGSERVLLVLHDSEARLSLQQILETLGYAVMSAENFEDADRVLASAPSPALLICERSRERLHRELSWIESLQESNTAIRQIALLQAGGNADEIAPDSDGYLFRPLTVPELARTVRDVLKGQ